MHSQHQLFLKNPRHRYVFLLGMNALALTLGRSRSAGRVYALNSREGSNKLEEIEKTEMSVPENK